MTTPAAETPRPGLDQLRHILARLDAADNEARATLDAGPVDEHMEEVLNWAISGIGRAQYIVTQRLRRAEQQACYRRGVYQKRGAAST